MGGKLRKRRRKIKFKEVNMKKVINKAPKFKVSRDKDKLDKVAKETDKRWHKIVK